MVKLLEETAETVAEDALDAVMTEMEEREARARFAQTPPSRGGNDPDLSDGGVINGARLTPMNNGRPVEKGRAVARRAWTWNGSETVLPLAWNPDGTVHDGGRRYLLKRFCLCCKSGGFKKQQCPNCVKNNCDVCRAGTDRTKVHTFENGKTVRGWIIPCFYLRKEDVPFPDRFYGSIDCFQKECIRRGSRGFKTEEDMRMHGRSRHRTEYLIWQDVIQANKNDEIESLRRRLDALLLTAPAQVAPVAPARRERSEEDRKALSARMHAAKKAKREKQRA